MDLGPTPTEGKIIRGGIQQVGKGEAARFQQVAIDWKNWCFFTFLSFISFLVRHERKTIYIVDKNHKPTLGQRRRQ
ncbi:MAG: hypothetical protein PVF83_19730 [Anaerolineales bacterium]